jgi:hypothetical protein
MNPAPLALELNPEPLNLYPNPFTQFNRFLNPFNNTLNIQALIKTRFTRHPFGNMTKEIKETGHMGTHPSDGELRPRKMGLRNGFLSLKKIGQDQLDHQDRAAFGRRHLAAGEKHPVNPVNPV